MRSFKFSPWLGVWIAGCLLLGAAPASNIEFESSNTRVGLARVSLHVESLVLVGDRLEGRYEVRVRFAPMLNDRGIVVLQPQGSLDELFARGGQLVGLAASEEDGRRHPVVCDFQPGGAVHITIDTGNRLLSFDSRLRNRPDRSSPAAVSGM